MQSRDSALQQGPGAGPGWMLSGAQQVRNQPSSTFQPEALVPCAFSHVLHPHSCVGFRHSPRPYETCSRLFLIQIPPTEKRTHFLVRCKYTSTTLHPMPGGPITNLVYAMGCKAWKDHSEHLVCHAKCIVV